MTFSYWRGRKDLEVDILAEANLQLIPFEVKYSRSPVQESDLKGLHILCKVVTFPGKVESSILKIPAPLACYWLSRSEGRS